VRLGLFEELLGPLFARLRQREQLKGLLPEVVGLLFVRLCLLEEHECRVFVRLRLAKRALRLLLVRAGLNGGGRGLDLVLLCPPGVLRRLFRVPRGVPIVLRGAVLCHTWIIALSLEMDCPEVHRGAS
jgi:hypothetical protein